MKRFLCFVMCIVLFLLCGCNAQKENSDTVFLFDTVVSVSAECGKETLDEAVLYLRSFEKKLSVTNKDSEVYAINGEKGFFEVGDDTLKIIKKSLYYGEITKGKYDITVYPITSLWDFKEKKIPSEAKIKAALLNVGYKDIEIKGTAVNLNGKKIDLGSIAKGYISDRLRDFLTEKGVENATINLGGNICIMGKEKTVGIKKPFSNNEIIGNIKIKNKCLSTAGVYERCFEKEGRLYHHILDTKTGYPVKSDLVSATVISDSSFEADPLSTVCILIGKDEAIDLIEKTKNTEAILIDSRGEVYYTSGIERQNDEFFVKN